MVRIPAGSFPSRIAAFWQTLAAAGASEHIGVVSETRAFSIKAQGTFLPEAAETSLVAFNKGLHTAASRAMAHIAGSMQDGGAVTALPFANAYFETLTRGEPSVRMPCQLSWGLEVCRVQALHSASSQQ